MLLCAGRVFFCLDVLESWHVVANYLVLTHLASLLLSLLVSWLSFLGGVQGVCCCLLGFISFLPSFNLVWTFVISWACGLCFYAFDF